MRKKTNKNNSGETPDKYPDNPVKSFWVYISNYLKMIFGIKWYYRLIIFIGFLMVLFAI